jgi:hypothetical protein
MTSGVALATSITEQQNSRGGGSSSNAESSPCYWESSSGGESNQTSVPRLVSEKMKEITRKRPPALISTPVFKKIRTSVQRTHSPKTLPSPLSSPVLTAHVQTITPTVRGIQEVARHLLKTTGETPYSLLALPTECTYEACSVVSWSKAESLTEAATAFRINQLDKRKCDRAESSFAWQRPHQSTFGC